MIGRGLDTGLGEIGGQALGAVLQGHVDDGGARYRLGKTGPQPLDQGAGALIRCHRHHREIQIRSIETGGGDVFVGDGEALAHILYHARGRRGGQQQHLGNAELALIVG